MPGILDGLNEAQKTAVTHERGPLLIVAGAGTGKTTVLARRFVWLMQEKGLTADNILALTFTEKAAEEMEDRVLQLLPNGAYDFWISTFHGFCQRLLEERALEIGLPNRFNVMNETDAWLLLKRKIQELPLDQYRPLGNPVKFLQGLLKHFSRAKDEGVTPERYLAFARDASLDGDQEFVDGERKRLQELADCYHAYQFLLRQEGRLDFGDLIVETLRLLRERPAALKAFRDRFKVIMVDEFQDTNWAQYELVKLLAGDERNITVVGDDDQAIYKFRGASLANILQFRDDYPEAKTVALTQNYRSRQEILDVAYGFIRKNDPYRLEVQLTDLGLSKKLAAAGAATEAIGEPLRARWFRSLDEEAEFVARDLTTAKEADPTLTWNDIAILVRSNDGALPFVAALERHGIPFRFFALRGLYAKPIVVDLVALLSLAVSTHDNAMVWKGLTLETFGFPARDVATFLEYAQRKSLSLWQAMKQAAILSASLGVEGVKRASDFLAKIEGLAEAAKRETPIVVLQRALDRTGFLAHLLTLPEGEKMERLNALNGFAARIKRYELSTHAPNLKDFLDELKMEIESGEEGALEVDPNAGPDMVKIMTVHASKGLEFKNVYVVSLVDQRFPTRERHDAIPLPLGLVNERLPEGDAHLQEERRLMYVAMTRAKSALTLTGAANYGGARQKKPSVFFSEIGIERTDGRIADGELLALTTPEETLAEQAEREVYPLKRRFSFTQLAAFRKCPLQYKFSHVYRIPILGSHQKSFGQTIHLTLHDVLDLHAERGKAQQTSLFAPTAVVPAPVGFRTTMDEAFKIYDERWATNDLWYPDRATYDRYHDEGRVAVKRMIEEWQKTPPNIFALEQPFDWKLGEHSIKGSVDRMDVVEGGVAIYDYKTGQSRSSDDLESGEKEQLRIYQLAMEQRGLSVKKLAYIYVLSGEVAEVDLIQGEDREAFTEEMGRRMKEILASRFPPQPSPFLCRTCDFRHICPSRKL